MSIYKAATKQTPTTKWTYLCKQSQTRKETPTKQPTPDTLHLKLKRPLHNIHLHYVTISPEVLAQMVRNATSFIPALSYTETLRSPVSKYAGNITLCKVMAIPTAVLSTNLKRPANAAITFNWNANTVHTLFSHSNQWNQAQRLPNKPVPESNTSAKTASHPRSCWGTTKR